MQKHSEYRDPVRPSSAQAEIEAAPAIRPKPKLSLDGLPPEQEELLRWLLRDPRYRRLQPFSRMNVPERMRKLLLPLVRAGFVSQHHLFSLRPLTVALAVEARWCAITTKRGK